MHLLGACFNIRTATGIISLSLPCWAWRSPVQTTLVVRVMLDVIDGGVLAEGYGLVYVDLPSPVSVSLSASRSRVRLPHACGGPLPPLSLSLFIYECV